MAVGRTITIITQQQLQFETTCREQKGKQPKHTRLHLGNTLVLKLFQLSVFNDPPLFMYPLHNC